MWYQETLQRKNDKVTDIKSQKMQIEIQTQEDLLRLRKDLRETQDEYQQKINTIE